MPGSTADGEPDARTTSVEDLEEDVPVTLGELAREAIEELRAASQ